MKIHLIKEKDEHPRMSTILNLICNALIDQGYIVEKVNHIESWLTINSDRGREVINGNNTTKGH